MRFGVALDLGLGPSIADRLTRLRPVLAAAESVGFGSVWVGESYAVGGTDPRRFHLPNALMAAVALGSHTSLPIGTGVNLMRAWHPLRFAYDAALADQLLGGRLIVGLGLGPKSLNTRFGLMPDGAASIDGFIKSVRQTWRPDESEPWPSPLQEGGPRVLVGGGVPRSARRAAQLGDGFYASSGYSLKRLRPLVDIYLNALAGVRRLPPNPTVAVNRITVVAENPDEAARLGREHAAGLMRIYQRLGTWTEEDEGDLTVHRDGELALVGTPSQVALQLERYRQAGVTDVYFRVAIGTLPISAAVRTVELLGTTLSGHD